MTLENFLLDILDRKKGEGWQSREVTKKSIQEKKTYLKQGAGQRGGNGWG